MNYVSKIMLDLFKKVTHTLNIRNGLIKTKLKLYVMVQKALPDLVQKYDQLFQTK